MKSVLTLLIGLSIGALVGWFVAGSVTTASEVANGAPEAARSASPGAAPAAPSLERAPGEGARRQPATPEGRGEANEATDVSDVPLFHDGLRAHGEEGIRTGWSKKRGDEIPPEQLDEGLATYERTVLEAPEAIGFQLAERQNEHDVASGLALQGDVLLLLETLHEGVGPLPAFVQDGGAFAGLFDRTMPSLEVRAEGHLASLDDLESILEDGVTLRFPAGVFRVELARVMSRMRKPFPIDVSIRGAGMDQTLLIMGDLLPRSALRGFRIADCTVYADDSFTDIRGQNASLWFERVRFTGFDCGHGSTAWLNASRTALFARHCRVEGGYGRGRSGRLLDVRTPGLLARFEACTIGNIQLSLRHIRDGATVVFANCMLTELLGPPEEAKDGVVFVGSTVEYIEPMTYDATKRDLNELFPNWESRIR